VLISKATLGPLRKTHNLSLTKGDYRKLSYRRLLMAAVIGGALKFALLSSLCNISGVIAGCKVGLDCQVEPA
jgi:hypothetical protein